MFFIFYCILYPSDTEAEKDENTMEIDDVQPSTTKAKKGSQNKAKTQLHEFRCGIVFSICRQ